MRTIRISEEVWNEIAKRGVFGETPDIVLKKVFGIDNNIAGKHKYRRNISIKSRKKDRYATDRLSTRIIGNSILVSFASGKSRSFELPDHQDREEVRDITTNVMNFVKEHGGTEGQVNAARKALTDAGYHIVK